MLLINEKIHSNCINEKQRFTMMAVVVTVGVIVGTIFVTTLSPQLSYAQNASRGASMVNNQTNASKATSAATTTTPSNSTIGLKLGNLVYPLKYQIIGGKLASISAEKDNTTLLVTVSSKSNGNLTIELPRNVIDSKKQGSQEASFVVFQDGQYSSASDQIKTDAQARILSINFDNGTEHIEIAGTQMGPAITSQVTTGTPTTINPANATAAPASQVTNATKPPANATAAPASQVTNATKPPANATAAKTSTNATSAKSSASVTTAATTTAPSNSTTNLKSGSKMYPLNYRITGSGNKLNSVSLEKDSSTLLLNISSPSHGTLIIELPRNIIDSKRQGTNHDQNYVVFEDSQYVPVTQLKNNTQSRTLAIDFDKGSLQIEVAGTHAVPEFGAIISAVILAIAIVGIIVATTKFNGLFNIAQKR